MGNPPACAREALDMVRAGLGYLAAADAAQLSAAMQAECLRGLERAGSVLTAARASMLAGVTAGQGYADDAAYSARSWLIHQTHITSGAPCRPACPSPPGARMRSGAGGCQGPVRD